MTDGSALGERISRLLDPVRSHAAMSRCRAALAAVGVLASALAFGCFGGPERNPPVPVPAGVWLAIVPGESGGARQLLARAEQDPQAGTRDIVPGVETYRVADGRTVVDRFLEGPAAALADFVRANAPPSHARQLVLLERKTDGGARTCVVNLATPIDLDRPRFHLDHDEVGRPHLVTRFHPADARRLAALTSAHLGERLALVAGADQLLAAPTIRSPIGAEGKLTFGSGSTEAELRTLLDGLPGATARSSPTR